MLAFPCPPLQHPVTLPKSQNILRRIASIQESVNTF